MTWVYGGLEDLWRKSPSQVLSQDNRMPHLGNAGARSGCRMQVDIFLSVPIGTWWVTLRCLGGPWALSLLMWSSDAMLIWSSL